MYCINCGNEIDEINQICHGCGTRVDENKKIFVGIQKKKIEDNDRITDTVKKKNCENCGIVTGHIDKGVTIPAISPINIANNNSKKSGIAAVLSFIIPGLGQIYKGRIGVGSIFLMIGLALIELNRLLIGDTTFRKSVPDIRYAMAPGIRETIPDIRIIIFAALYIIFWIYNTHHAYTINHQEVEKKVKEQLKEEIKKYRSGIRQD